MGKIDENELISQLESELNGDAGHDIDILTQWTEKYRGNPETGLLNRTISHRLFNLLLEENAELPTQIVEDVIAGMEETYIEARQLISLGKYEEAVQKLQPLEDLIADLPLPEDTVWMDFNSYLDSLLYQDFFEDFIDGREIGRHPMHPGKILFTLGSLLIELNRPEEAADTLQMLLTYDPVCPKYLYEMTEAYKRTGDIQDAAGSSLQGLSCASTNEELARGYRNLAYCMSEAESYENAMMLNLLSLYYQPSRHAETEIEWIQKKAGISPDDYSGEMILKRCEELNIPVGISEEVKHNMDFLNMIMGNDNKEN